MTVCYFRRTTTVYRVVSVPLSGLVAVIDSVLTIYRTDGRLTVFEGAGLSARRRIDQKSGFSRRGYKGEMPYSALHPWSE
jgi:hypothetical protein